jgi:hypothetical protein
MKVIDSEIGAESFLNIIAPLSLIFFIHQKAFCFSYSSWLIPGFRVNSKTHYFCALKCGRPRANAVFFKMI